VGVKVHKSNLVSVQTGIRSESVLQLSCVQNHINCANTGILAQHADQFFMANLIYHNNGLAGHNGIWIKGKDKVATSHVVTGNIIAGVQVRCAMLRLPVLSCTHFMCAWVASAGCCAAHASQSCASQDILGCNGSAM
jgi:hypothetical protein